MNLGQTRQGCIVAVNVDCTIAGRLYDPKDLDLKIAHLAHTMAKAHLKVCPTKIFSLWSSYGQGTGLNTATLLPLIDRSLA